VKCLDTNTVIAVLNDRPAGARGRLAPELASGGRIGIPTVALFELIYGYEKRAQRAQNEAALRSLLTLDVEPLPFELADAEHDGPIAAQARRHGAALVTANQREFARVQGLDVVDWATS